MMGDYLYDLLSCILFLKLVLFILNIQFSHKWPVFAASRNTDEKIINCLIRIIGTWLLTRK